MSSVEQYSKINEEEKRRREYGDGDDDEELTLKKNMILVESRTLNGVKGDVCKWQATCNFKWHGRLWLEGQGAGTGTGDRRF